MSNAKTKKYSCFEKLVAFHADFLRQQRTESGLSKRDLAKLPQYEVGNASKIDSLSTKSLKDAVLQKFAWKAFPSKGLQQSTKNVSKPIVENISDRIDELIQSRLKSFKYQRKKLEEDQRHLAACSERYRFLLKNPKLISYRRPSEEALRSADILRKSEPVQQAFSKMIT